MPQIDCKKCFYAYPDVLTINEFRAMLGGIGDNYARKLLRQNLVEHFYICGTYYIPKMKVIDYMLSPIYVQTLNRFSRSHKLRTCPQATKDSLCCLGKKQSQHLLARNATFQATKRSNIFFTPSKQDHTLSLAFYKSFCQQSQN